MNAKHCNETNPELFSEFSDTYKDVNGIRPRFFITEEGVNDWMIYLRKESARQAAEYREEKAFEKSLREGTHPAFTTPDVVLTYSPFAAI